MQMFKFLKFQKKKKNADLAANNQSLKINCVQHRKRRIINFI